MEVYKIGSRQIKWHQAEAQVFYMRNCNLKLSFYKLQQMYQVKRETLDH